MKKIKIEDIILNYVAYDSDSNILELRFNDGEIRRYSGVSNLTYKSLMASKAPGDYFQNNIGSSHPFEIIEYGYATLD